MQVTRTACDKRDASCAMHASDSGTRSIEARTAERHARFTTRPDSLSDRPCTAM